MRRAKRRTLQFDALEALTLLSAAPPAVSILQTGTPLPATTIQTMQQTASGGHLELMLSQVASLFSSSPDVQQYSQAVIAGHQMSDLQLNEVASSKGVALPPTLLPGDLNVVRMALAGLGSQNFDQAYLTTMVAINMNDLPLAQQLAASSDPQVQQIGQAGVMTDQMHIAAAQAILGGGSNTLAPPTPVVLPGGGAALTQADISGLQTDYSMNNLEILLSMVANASSGNQGVQLYAMKLAFDHEQSNTQLLQIAQAGGASLTPGLSAGDQAIARQTLSSLAGITTGDPTAFDRAYLNANVPIHQMALAANQQLSSSTQNPNVRVFAMNNAATSYVHLLADQQLLGGNNGGGGGGHQNFQATARGLRFGQQVFSAGRSFTSHYTLQARAIGRPAPGATGRTGAAATLFADRVLSQMGQPVTIAASGAPGLTIQSEHLRTQGNTVIYTMAATDGSYIYNSNYTLQVGRAGNARPNPGGPASPQAAARMFAMALMDELAQNGLA